jgi:hypothetical protein
MDKKKKPRPAPTMPMSKKRAAEAVAALKAQGKKKPKPKAKAKPKGAAKLMPKPEAAKNMTDAQIAAVKRAVAKKINTQVTKLPAKKGAKPTPKQMPFKKGSKSKYKPY